jgi:hypothetical protein
VKLATKKFTVQKGKKAKIHVYLSARALKLLKKTGKLRARVVVIVKNSLKKDVRVVPGIVTLQASQGLLGTTPGERTVVVPKPAEKKLPEPKLEIEP